MPYSQIIQAIPDAAIFTTPNGIVQAWNKAATTLFGWSADEMIGRPFLDRFPASARVSDQEQFKRFTSEIDWDGEFLDYRKDGTRVLIEAHVHPVRENTGKTTGILSVLREIHRQRTAEYERQSFRNYTNDILNSMHANVAVLGPDGCIREINQAWERFAKENSPNGLIPTTTTVGNDYVSVCKRSCGKNADEARAAAQGIEDVLQGRRTMFVLEYPCDSPAEHRWFSMHVTPIKTGDGGAVVAHYDITSRKLAELRTLTQNRRTELALNAAHMGVWTLHLSSGQIQWTSEVYKIVGVTEFEGNLDAWFRLVHPEDLPQINSNFKSMLERRMPVVSEFRIIRPNGEIAWLTNVVQVECDPTGEVVALVGTVQDITAKKRSEWAIKTYNQILELITLGSRLDRILEEVVALVEEQLPGSLCSILIVDQANGCLRSGAGKSLPPEYNQKIDGVKIGPKEGSCGTAVYRKQTVTVTDIATDPLWEDYRELALSHGLKSCVSVPIFSSGNVPGHEKGQVIGTFALYNRKTGDFDRLTYAVLTGAEQLVRRAILTDQDTGVSESIRVIEATHLAGVAIEREQAGLALRESEERFRAVFNSATSAIYVKDLSGHHLFVNRATAEMFGVPQALWIGKRTRELLPAHLADICENNDRAVLAAQHPVEKRITSTLPDGKEATVLATHVLLRKADGAPYAICGILRDITELVSAQRDVERLWHNATDPLCIVGFDGYFKQINPVWSRLLGWSDEELLRVPYREFLHPEDQSKLVELEQQIHKGERILGYENRFRCRDGSYRWLSWNAIPVLENRVVYGLTRDVTEEKKLSHQVQQAQKMEAIGQLASGVAHDFNNLLTVINGFSEILMTELATTEQQRDCLSQVLEAGQRAAELTSQLLAFSRKAMIEPKILDLNQVVESSTRMLRRLIGENVRLNTKLGSIPLVKIDPGQLEQVFMNLAVNARDAMPNGGELLISTETVELKESLQAESSELPPGQYVRVNVADNGNGMAPEVRARIFEPFFTTKGPGKGTGLGLATVYGIIRQAGGTIVVESEPGHGTTFRMLLQAELQEEVSGKPAAITLAPRGAERILLVEDEEGVRRIATTVLQMQGYTVVAAKNGTEAVQIVRENPERFDLLLTDVVMPDFGGRTLAEKIRSLSPRINVLYMSGYTDDAVIRSGVESAKDPFIQKPFTPMGLARRVREVLDGQRG